ncbi:MAG: SPOR domain-containing protein [Hyphomicrobiaceae bacterium]
MRRVRLKFGVHGLAVALVCAACLCDDLLPSAHAQTTPEPAAPKVAKAKRAKAPAAATAQQQDAAPAAKDPAVALAAYTSGVKAYQAGKFDSAILSLNSAINNGGLTSNLMAKALYYRGGASQQTGKSGQAISDLTSALWFKTGLDTAERAEATKFRSAAYRDAGLPETAVGGQSAPPETGALSSGLTTSKPAPSSGLGNVFGNLFGGSNSQSASPPAPAVTAPPPPAPVAVAATGESEVLPWANRPAQPATQDAAPAEPPAAPAKAAKAPPVKPAKAAKPGDFRVQVAAVKTRDEASAIVSKLQTLGGAIATTPSAVDETTFGSMGKFFRVRLGPYASAADAKAPCETLKSSGLDCLVTGK